MEVRSIHVDVLGLASSVFGKLSASETALVAAAQVGGFAFCGTSQDLAHPSNDVEKTEGWGPDRTIRASLIRWLCLELTARGRVGLRVGVCGAIVAEKLDLSYLNVPFGLALLRCKLVEDAQLFSTTLTELDLRGSWIRSLTADHLDLKGSAYLSDGFRSESEVRIAGAHIGSNFVCDGAKFNPSANKDISGTRVALNAERVKVAGYMFLRNGFYAEGEVRLSNAEIGSNLECERATFTNPSVEKIAESGIAIRANGIKVNGDLSMSTGFQAHGEVRLRGANIEGDLNFESADLIHPAKMALDCDRVRVGGYVFLRRVTAKGELKFLNAKIASNLECDGAKLTNPVRKGLSGSGRALSAENIRVGGYVFLREGFYAEGEVNLANAQIDSDLLCIKATLKNEGEVGSETVPETVRIALLADGVNVKGSIFFSEGTSLEGEVSILNSRVGGNVACGNARIEGRFLMQSTSVAGTLFWVRIIEPERTELDLVNSRVGSLNDDCGSWPSRQRLRIDGFFYERFSGSDTPKSAKERLDWLGRQRNFAPQPYRQLAEVLKNEGDDAGARVVLFEMERVRRRKEDRGFLALLWSAVLRFTIGFGYYPSRSLLWLLGLTFLCGLLFWEGYVFGSFTPTDRDAYASFRLSGQLPASYERFHASAYALENSFPLVKLGQTEQWRPDPGFPLEGAATKRMSGPLRWAISPGFLRWARWIQICLGWFFTTMFVAAVTGVVRKE